MRRKQRLKELTIKVNFMFGAVMMDEDNCKGLLERVLELPIERVEISREKALYTLSDEVRPPKACITGCSDEYIILSIRASA